MHSFVNQNDAQRDVLKTVAFERPNRILIIDTDNEDRARLALLLAKENHAVEVANDGPSGLKIAAEERPDLVLIAVNLPGADGCDICRHLKNDPELHDAPVILIAENNTAEVFGLECGANDFVRKPVDWLVLRARVTVLLKYRRAVSALRQSQNELESRVRERTSQLEKALAEHKRIELALVESEERYALAADGANDGLWDWNLKTGEIYFSPRWKAMLGYEESEIVNSPEEWYSRLHIEDLAQFKSSIQTHLAGITANWRLECRMKHRDGKIRWMYVRGMGVRGKDGIAYRMAGSQSDITSRKIMELQLRHDAFHDALTGLPNRALFNDRLQHSIARMKRNPNYCYAVLLLDVDRFKIVNDSLGHSIGDHLLIEFARRVKHCPRTTDTMARLGGDEFIVLLEDVASVEGANVFADRINDELKEPFILDNRQVFVTTSIGIAIGKKRYEKTDEVLRDADTALYQAKAAGLGRQEVFTSGMHVKVMTLLDLEHDLRRAVGRNEFVLHYQPIVSLLTGKIVSFEALLRWKHPARGMVSPLEFIPLAEETDLITPITMWVLRQACEAIKLMQAKHPRNPPLSISVNLSGRAFSRPNLVPEIAGVMNDCQIAPGSIKFEITEGAVMQNAQAAMAMLALLRSMNIELLVDDFGTGYSSLSYLHRLPLDVLKIDRSFVSRMGTGDKNSSIVRTIAMLAGNLGLKMVAEGIETADQLSQLRALNCEYGQGYLFSKAVPLDVADNMLGSDPKW